MDNKLNIQSRLAIHLKKALNILAPLAIILVFLFLAELAEDLLKGPQRAQGISGLFPLSTLDKEIFLLVNVRLSTPVLDTVAKYLTRVGSTIFWFGIAAVLWSKGRRKDAALLFIALSMDGALNYTMKGLLHIPRPYQVLPEARILDTDRGFSFPSGHAESSFLSAVIIGKGLPRVLPFLLTFASIIAYSRVYVGAHWPSDVIFGGIIGVTEAIVILQIEKALATSWFDDNHGNGNDKRDMTSPEANGTAKLSSNSLSQLSANAPVSAPKKAT
jgi:undecaprenyl-diphosphatase